MTRQKCTICTAQIINVTGVSDKHLHEVAVNVTPQHPETELRKAETIYNHNTAFKISLPISPSSMGGWSPDKTRMRKRGTARK
ncbi:MAG: hypothetical protein R2911_07525 [Caldilineaceae bacterium]